MTTFPLWLKHRELAQAQATKIAQVLREADIVYTRPSSATAAGDERKLRGIPAIGRGVQGARPDQRPGHNLK